jgi:hypothetical protein
MKERKILYKWVFLWPCTLSFKMTLYFEILIILRGMAISNHGYDEWAQPSA